MNKAERVQRVVTFRKKKFLVKEEISSGMTSVVYKTTCGHVIKKFNLRLQTRGHFERECFWLKKLASSGAVPAFINCDNEAREILMADGGDPITPETLPDDWKSQMTRILTVLEENDCRHNDLSEGEVLVKDGIIKIIDFGFASLGDDVTCGGRFTKDTKNRIYQDKYIVNLIDFLMGSLLNNIENSEVHDFVLWDRGEYARAEQAINEKFTILQAIMYSPKTFKILGKSRRDVLERFYHGKMSHHGEKGKTPFTVFVVLDAHPVYEIRRNVFNNDKSIVNINTFDLLQKVRAGRTGVIHGSDNIQESYENLKTLTFYEHNIPVCYWDHWRPTFSSFVDFFARLNGIKELEYVVLRNFEDLPADEHYGEKSDLDILVNDYFLFKRVTGAISYKHKRLKRHPRGGPAVEYGGYKVAGKVRIGEREVSVDVRFVGDNYYPQEWERNILKNRSVYNGFYVPGETNLFYSLLYHALVHKRKMSDEYRNQLKEMMCEIQVGKCNENLDDTKAWSLLDNFMEENEYSYVRPNELTLPFNAHSRAGISIERDIQHAQNMITKGRYVEANHLLRQVLSVEKYNVKAYIALLLLWPRLFIEEEGNRPLKRFLIRVKSLLTYK